MNWGSVSDFLGLAKGGPVRVALEDLWANVIGDRAASGATGVAFTIAVVSLCAKMAKADGIAIQVEADTFERHFSVPPEEMTHVRRLFDLAKQDVAGFDVYAEQIASLLKHEPVILSDVFECLFHIAAADGILHGAEENFLKIVAATFGIGTTDYLRLRALFVHDPTSPYAVLGTSPADSDETLRARHRQLVIEHHPDRLLAHGVPKQFARMAERKLAAINAAWDLIKQERGL